jgi:hypothetical protein
LAFSSKSAAKNDSPSSTKENEDMEMKDEDSETEGKAKREKKEEVDKKIKPEVEDNEEVGETVKSAKGMYLYMVCGITTHVLDRYKKTVPRSSFEACKIREGQGEKRGC